MHTGGEGTFFTQNGQAGACGDKHSDDDFLAAVDWQIYSPGNIKCDIKSPWCGQLITIFEAKNHNNNITALVADCCPTCVSINSVDMSVGTIRALNSDYERVGEFPSMFVFFKMEKNS